jgi:hypothetical protein
MRLRRGAYNPARRPAYWAMDCATRLDPVVHPESVAKTVRLDFSKLSEEQFRKWLSRVPKA